MSKRLDENAAQLMNIAHNNAMDVRRVLREYAEVTRHAELGDYVLYVKEREVDRVVSRYVKVHRQLRKIRRKIDARK
jgi:hypothetical protein